MRSSPCPPLPTPPLTIGAIRPSAPLTAYVDHYWFSASASEPVTVLLPDGRIDVVLEQSIRQASVEVYGSVTSRTTLALTPGARYVGIQFRPGVARHFVGAAAHELTNRAVDGRDVLRCNLASALDTDDPRELPRGDRAPARCTLSKLVEVAGARLSNTDRRLPCP